MVSSNVLNELKNISMNKVSYYEKVPHKFLELIIILLKSSIPMIYFKNPAVLIFSLPF